MQVCIRASLHSTQSIKKEQMHGPANNLNVATWMHEWGYYVGVHNVSYYFLRISSRRHALTLCTPFHGLQAGRLTLKLGETIEKRTTK